MDETTQPNPSPDGGAPEIPGEPWEAEQSAREAQIWGDENTATEAPRAPADLDATTSTPAPATPPAAANPVPPAGSAPEAEHPAADVETLRHRAAVADGMLKAQGSELKALREELAALKAQPPAPAPAPAATPEPEAEEAPPASWVEALGEETAALLYKDHLAELRKQLDRAVKPLQEQLAQLAPVKATVEQQQAREAQRLVQEYGQAVLSQAGGAIEVDPASGQWLIAEPVAQALEAHDLMGAFHQHHQNRNAAGVLKLINLVTNQSAAPAPAAPAASPAPAPPPDRSAQQRQAIAAQAAAPRAGGAAPAASAPQALTPEQIRQYQYEISSGQISPAREKQLQELVDSAVWGALGRG